MPGRRGDEGFTLVEMLVVVAVVGLLVTMVVPKVAAVLDRGRVTTAQASATALHAALERYHFDHSNYPSATTNYGEFKAAVDDMVDMPTAAGEADDAPFIFISFTREQSGEPHSYVLRLLAKSRTRDVILVTPDGVVVSGN